MERLYGNQLATDGLAERLDAVFGDEPRRIFGAVVLADAGASITECSTARLRVASPVLPDLELAATHSIRPRQESLGTLSLWAERPSVLLPYLGERTWVSTLERAVLEAVDAQDVSMLPLEIAAKALSWGVAGTADRIIACADALGLERALRMLRSLARALKDRRGLAPVPTPEGMLYPLYDLLAESPRRPSTADWVLIDDLDSVDRGITLRDYDNRVVWVDHPQHTIDSVLT